MLNKISEHRKRNVAWSNLYVEYKLANLIEAENKMVVTRDVGREMCSCYSMDMFSVIQAELFLEICYSA